MFYGIPKYGMQAMGIDILVIIIVSCVCGFICKAIRKSKDMDGGFGWGFWLGVIGIIVVACQQPAQAVASNTYSVSRIGGAGYWTCSKCGRENAPYVTSCSCGTTKAQSLLHAKKAEEAVQKIESGEQKRSEEENTISLLKQYKELMDSGVITQDEFERKKKNLLK